MRDQDFWIQEPYINDMCISASRGPVKAADIPASTNEAYQLSKFSGEAVSHLICILENELIKSYFGLYKHHQLSELTTSLINILFVQKSCHFWQ